MKHILPLALLSSCLFAKCLAADDADKQPTPLPVSSATNLHDFVVLPNSANAVQFRLYTNATPDASHLFNTFEIEAYGEKVLQSPGGESLKRWPVRPPTGISLHNLLVDGRGPELHGTNGMTLIEQALGPDWSYLALDATQAYRGRLEQYRRGILFVAPDLFVIHDHIVAKAQLNFQMWLHPPAGTQVDPIWHDLRLDLPKASLRINAPSRRELRAWEQVMSPADAILPDTMTVKIGPTNKVSQADLITVFAVQPGGKKMDYVFKLVESNTAVGARIHREALPTLVAFRLDATQLTPSLDSFKFSGPVGVSVFRPKRSTP